MNSSQLLTRRGGTIVWWQSLAFGLLICLPLLVGALAQVSTPTAPCAIAQNPVPQKLASQRPAAQAGSVPTPQATKASAVATNTTEVTVDGIRPDDATLLVATFDGIAGSGSQTEEEEDCSPIQEPLTSKEKQEQQPEPKAEQKEEDPQTEAPQPKSDAADSPGNGEIVAGDALSEFEQWTQTLDDNIRQSVVDAMTTQLEAATNDLDLKNATIERLHVETEFYKMQIQHLLSRLQEWKPIEKDP